MFGYWLTTCAFFVALLVWFLGVAFPFYGVINSFMGSYAGSLTAFILPAGVYIWYGIKIPIWSETFDMQNFHRHAWQFAQCDRSWWAEILSTTEWGSQAVILLPHMYTNISCLWYRTFRTKTAREESLKQPPRWTSAWLCIMYPSLHNTKPQA